MNVFSTKVVIAWDSIFTSPCRHGTLILRSHPSPAEGVASGQYSQTIELTSQIEAANTNPQKIRASDYYWPISSFII